jgi:hypothetical protein
LPGVLFHIPYRAFIKISRAATAFGLVTAAGIQILLILYGKKKNNRPPG